MYDLLGDLLFLICQGVDLRQYSRQIEGDLHEVENASILDCILTLHCLHCSLNVTTCMGAYWY